MEESKTFRQEVLSLLEKADEILSDENRWCKDHSAKDKHEESVPLFDKRAYKFCLFGAVRKVDNTPLTSKVCQRAIIILQEEVGEDITDFNDHRETSFSNVKAVLSRAIAVARRDVALSRGK